MDSHHPSNRIHPTAIVDPSAELGRDNYIGPYCIVGPNVRIGDNNTFTAHVSVGMPAEHRDFFREDGEVVIGSHNMIREFVTINGSTTKVTRMGNKCVMLRGSHLSHDSVLEDMVNVSCNVLIGGETYVMIGANLGLGCIIHQRQVIGAWAMIGMGTIVPKNTDIEPGWIYVGNPARALKMNSVGLDRAKVLPADLEMEIKRYEHLRLP